MLVYRPIYIERRGKNVQTIGYTEIRQTQHSMLIYNFNKMSGAACFDPLKGSSSGRIRSIYKCIKCTRIFFVFILFLPMPLHVPYGPRGLPSWLWPKCNRLLRLGRP
jgi:hypothetical protein